MDFLSPMIELHKNVGQLRAKKKVNQPMRSVDQPESTNKRPGDRASVIPMGKL